MSGGRRRVIVDTDPSAGVPGADIDDVLSVANARFMDRFLPALTRTLSG